MIICDICTGRHLTAACVIARANIDACLSGTPDDYTPIAGVVSLDVERQRRSGLSPEENSARRALRHRQRWYSNRTA